MTKLDDKNMVDIDKMRMKAEKRVRQKIIDEEKEFELQIDGYKEGYQFAITNWLLMIFNSTI